MVEASASPLTTLHMTHSPRLLDVWLALEKLGEKEPRVGVARLGLVLETESVLQGASSIFHNQMYIIITGSGGGHCY